VLNRKQAKKRKEPEDNDPSTPEVKTYSKKSSPATTLKIIAPLPTKRSPKVVVMQSEGSSDSSEEEESSEDDDVEMLTVEQEIASGSEVELEAESEPEPEPQPVKKKRKVVEEDLESTPKCSKKAGKAKAATPKSKDEGEELKDLTDAFDNIFAKKAVLEEDDDDDDDIVFIMGRKDEERPTRSESSWSKWSGMNQKERKGWPNTFYDAHEEPLGEMDPNTFVTMVKELGKKKVVFVATCGKYRNPRKQKLEQDAMKHILDEHKLGSSLQFRKLGERSAWALYGCETEEAVKKLVETEVGV
jgi:hypothetical protein